MTDIFHQEANAAAEALPAAALPPPVKSDWSATDPAAEIAGKNAGKTREQRRATIEAARDRVNAKYETKGERLAKASPGTRDAGSLRERNDTRDTLVKAAKTVGHVPGREENISGREELRKAVETLSKRYPGRKASDFVKIAREWESGFKTDPIGMREKLLETYAAVSPENFPEEPKEDTKEEPKRGPSRPRDSVRRAMADHATASDLVDFEKEFGGKLPAMLAELVKHDKALVDDPVGASARLSIAYGAPATERQQVAYEQRQAQQRAQQQDSQNVHRALDLIVQHKVLDGFDDDATMSAVADVLESKDFKRTGDRLADLKAAHLTVMNRRANSTRHAAGGKSISGAPSLRQPAEQHRSGVRRSIEVAKRGGR